MRLSLNPPGRIDDYTNKICLMVMQIGKRNVHAHIMRKIEEEDRLSMKNSLFYKL